MSLPAATTEREQARLAECTRPWQTDELSRVGTAARVCTFTDKVLVVRLHGSRTATVADLRERGHFVTLPRRIRGWSGA